MANNRLNANAKRKLYYVGELEKLKDNPDDPRHGTSSGYHIGCRCDRCKEFYRLDHKAKINRYLSEMNENPNDYRHGTYAGYTYGCRCDACKRAKSIYQRNQRHGIPTNSLSIHGKPENPID